MKNEIIKIAKDLEKGKITTKTARTLLLDLFGVCGSLSDEKQTKILATKYANEYYPENGDALQKNYHNVVVKNFIAMIDWIRKQ